jgi:hypothetical protein
MRLLVSLLTLAILAVTPLSAAQDAPMPTISDFSVRPASGQPEMHFGEDAIFAFKYAHVAGGLARSVVEIQFCVVGNAMCRPSTDWQLTSADRSQYPEESGTVTLHRRPTGTRPQNLIYVLTITDANGRKTSQRTTDPLRLR